MYYLPENEIKASSVYSKLEKNLKPMREVYLYQEPWQCEHVTSYGCDLILYSIDRDSLEISCRKFDDKGVVRKYKCGKIPDTSPLIYLIQRDWSPIAVESLPVVAFYYALQSVNSDEKDEPLKKFKIVFFDISGNVSHEIRVKDVLFDVGYVYLKNVVLTSSNYIGVYFKFYHKSHSFQPCLKTKQERSNEATTKLRHLFVLFEIQLKDGNYYECVEISRLNLEDYIEVENTFGDLIIENMVYNETEQMVLSQLRRSRFLFSEVLLALYDIKTRRILQTFVAFENPAWCITYFVNHLDFAGGIIIGASYGSNEIRLFTRNGENKFILFNCVSFKFEYSLSPVNFTPYCISNCKNQLLFFQVKENCVTVYDLFDMSNRTTLFIAAGQMPFRLHFNKTGEELYIYNGVKMHIYLYKPIFKSLTLLSASIVAKCYAKSKLIEMKLPKQLYKFF